MQAENADTHAVLVTGANGHLGRQLIARLASTRDVVAVVRRAAALAALPVHARIRSQVLDYTDAQALRQTMQGCSAVVHLVGIIKESAGSSFVDAHEATCSAVARAAAQAGVQRVIYLSIVGATAASTNACLASKARAEAVLLQGAVPALVLRLPMVLGEGDYASVALARRAAARLALTFRAASLEQPIYAGDVVTAILRALELEPPLRVALDLAGAESLSRRALTARAAAVLGKAPPLLLSLPIAFGVLLAALVESIAVNPPLSRALLGVLDHDDAIDPLPACRALGIALTGLDETLQRVLLAPPSARR